MRATIEALGGEYRFGTRVDDLDIETRPDGSRRLRGLHLAGGGYLRADHVVLALGHSARDTFAMLHARGVFMEAKPFSIGVRIEHPQALIDRARFGDFAGHKLLGAADYKLVHHAGDGRSVYSFCMCPGGRVVAATSEPGRVVTNGMSQYSRAEFNANAGIVVGVTPERDYPGRAAGRHRLAAPLGGARLRGGRRRLMRRRRSASAIFWPGAPRRRWARWCPPTSRAPQPADLAACLPDFAVAAIRAALPVFDRQIPGFAMADAVMTGVETRTSSPLRLRARCVAAERQYARAVSGRRGGGVCGRHSVGGDRWHPGGGGGGVERGVVRGRKEGQGSALDPAS